MTKRIFIPIILLWRDRTIDAGGASMLRVSWVFVRKGRTLTITNPSDEKFMIQSDFTMDLRGDVRVARKPREISVEDLQKLRDNKN